MIRHFCMGDDYLNKFGGRFEHQSQDDPFFDLSVDRNRIRGSLSSSSSVSSECDKSSTKTPSTSSERYKTELCRQYADSGQCRYGRKCQYAHGSNDLRVASRHPKYKTETCRTFHSTGFCPYGARCHFMHDEADVGSISPTPSVVSNAKTSSSSVCDFEALSTTDAEQMRLIQLLSQLIVASSVNESLPPFQNAHQKPQFNQHGFNRSVMEIPSNMAFPPNDSNLISQLAFNLNAFNSNCSVAIQPSAFPATQSHFNYPDEAKRSLSFNYVPC